MRHSTNLRWSELKVGMVVLISIIVVSMAIVSFGHLSDLLRPKQALTALFSDVRGLRRGAPVWLGGVEAGYVKKIRFPTKGEKTGIQVEMVVDADMATLIRADSTASIRTQGLLGDIYVEVALGSPAQPPLAPGRSLEGIIPVDIKELISGSSVTLADLSRTMRNLNGLMTKIAEGQGTAGHFVNDPALYDELTRLSTESRSLIEQIEKGQGTAGKLLRDPKLFDQLTATAGRIETAAKSFEQLGQELRQGQGTIGKLTNDPAVYDNLAAATARLDRLLAKVEAGEGLAGQLVTDQELTTNLKSALVEFKSAATEFRTLMEDIKKNPKKYFRMQLF